MYIVRQFTQDPTTAGAKEIHAVRYIDKKTAEGVAKAGSEHGFYMGIYADDGEQIKGFVNGKQVQ